LLAFRGGRSGIRRSIRRKIRHSAPSAGIGVSESVDVLYTRRALFGRHPPLGHSLARRRFGAGLQRQPASFAPTTAAETVPLSIASLKVPGAIAEPQVR
jgi:hypothetical protein